MTLKTKQGIIAVLAIAFLVSLIFVQWMEAIRRESEVGRASGHVSIPVKSRSCVECHGKSTPGIIDHWKYSTPLSWVGCVECHQAEKDDVDG
jgi:hypothetical protein